MLNFLSDLTDYDGNMVSVSLPIFYNSLSLCLEMRVTCMEKNLMHYKHEEPHRDFFCTLLEALVATDALLIFFY